MGVAHTDGLDFMLLNGGSGGTRTDESVGRVLTAVARALASQPAAADATRLLAALRPHSEMQAPQAPRDPGAAAGHRVAPHIDVAQRTIEFAIDEAGVSRIALYDAVLRLADRCFILLARPTARSIALRIRARDDLGPDALKALAAEADAGAEPRRARRWRAGEPRPVYRRRHAGAALISTRCCASSRPRIRRPSAWGISRSAVPDMRACASSIIRGTGACNSDCVFCVEKFDPAHRTMPKADATRQFILDNAGQFDMLFFASGEPTIHPKLLEYVELGREVGFTSFGMSSHFRTFADPAFTLRVLQAGFEYFDISLHAADIEGQLAVNPIADGGRRCTRR